MLLCFGVTTRIQCGLECVTRLCSGPTALFSYMLPLSVTLRKTGININPYSIFTIVATKCKIYVYAYVYVELLISDTIDTIRHMIVMWAAIGACISNDCYLFQLNCSSRILQNIRIYNKMTTFTVLWKLIDLIEILMFCHQFSRRLFSQEKQCQSFMEIPKSYIC